MKRKYLAVPLLTGLALAGGGVFAFEASAAPTTVYVSSAGTDSGSCTQAAPCASITYALNAVGAGGTIYVSGTLNDTTADPTDFPTTGPDAGDGVSIDKAVTIAASSGTNATIDGAGTNWLFDVTGAYNVSFSGLTLENGDSTGSNSGAITNDAGGTLTISDSTFSDNTTDLDGGAIDNADTDTGTGAVTISDSTFTGNTATDGGAIDNSQSDSGGTGTVTISDSTFTGNEATTDGGSIDNADDDLGTDTAILTVAASTFYGDSGSGEAIANDNGSGTAGEVYIGADIFAETCSDDGGWNDDGYSAENSYSCQTIASSDVTNTSGTVTSDLAAPLANNGGPTQTLMPTAGNPAIGLITQGASLDVGPGTDSPSDVTVTCSATADQRGPIANSTTGNCDAGAVQTWAILEPTLEFTSTTPTDATAGGSYTATASDYSSGAITYSAGAGTTNNACTVDPTTGVVTFVAAGTCDVAATQVADSPYAAATGAETDQTFTVTAAYVAPPSPPVTTTTTTTTTPPPTPTLSITTSQKTLTWCVGSGCSGYPNTALVITSPIAQNFRVVLETKSHGHWKQVATSQLKAHAGKNSFRIAGRWHGKLVPAGQVQLLVQTKNGNGWKTRKTLKLTITHKH